MQKCWGLCYCSIEKKEWARRSSNRAYCLSWKWVSRSVAIKNFICSQQIADFLYCNVQYMYIVYRPETYHKMNLIKSCFFPSYCDTPGSSIFERFFSQTIFRKHIYLAYAQMLCCFFALIDLCYEFLHRNGTYISMYFRWEIILQ